MQQLLATFLILFSGMTYADVPKEIQGTWTPDIEKSIVLFEKNMAETDSTFLREKYLPIIKRFISDNQFIHATGAREITADISLKEKQGSTFVMLVSSDSKPTMEVAFIPVDGGYIMQGSDAADGSGNIVWVKQ